MYYSLEVTCTTLTASKKKETPRNGRGWGDWGLNVVSSEPSDEGIQRLLNAC